MYIRGLSNRHNFNQFRKSRNAKLFIDTFYLYRTGVRVLVKGNNLRAQSAMEYLMTYGWAILIIAIVLGALFSLGVFSSSSFIGTTCIPSAGYFCSSPILHGGTFNVIVGQATGTTWATANVFFVSGGGSPSTVASGLTGCVYYGFANSISSGQTFTVSFNAPVTLTGGTASCGTVYSGTVGTSYSGAMWAEYTTTGVSGLQFAQIATATLKAT